MIDFQEVAAEDVSRHFGRRRALSHVSFRVEQGRILGLLGPNGAGKSTMLALLATLMSPAGGRIRYGTVGADADRSALRARIGMLGHDLFLYPELTARENLMFFAGLYGIEDARAAADVALDRAALRDRGDDPVSSLSRGMRQRVALERALIRQPRLLLMDEPFTGLDDASTRSLVDRLAALRQDGAMIVLATHDLETAEGLLDEAVFLRDGRVASAVERPQGIRSLYRAAVGHPN